LNVLFEKTGRHGRQAIGRSPYLQSVHVEDADHLIGQIVPVRIEHGQQNSLKGRLAEGVLKQPRSASAAIGNQVGA
jgi:tRNA-2-methylthio-N6-dimethylallyladenosine synthase